MIKVETQLTIIVKSPYIIESSCTSLSKSKSRDCAMLSAGFAPLASEWWHYQYGETYWAAFYGYETTKYDLITV